MIWNCIYRPAAMIQNPEFHITAISYIISLMAQRRYLIATGKSHVNVGYINSCLNELERYLSAYTYDSDTKMANFWLRHSEHIFALIPGKASGSHKTATKVFMQLAGIAHIIHDHPTVYWDTIREFSVN